MRNLKEEILETISHSNEYIESDMLRIEKELAYAAMQEYALKFLRYFINNEFDFSMGESEESDAEEILKQVEETLITQLPEVTTSRINFS